MGKLGNKVRKIETNTIQTSLHDYFLSTKSGWNNNNNNNNNIKTNAKESASTSTIQMELNRHPQFRMKNIEAKYMDSTTIEEIVLDSDSDIENDKTQCKEFSSDSNATLLQENRMMQLRKPSKIQNASPKIKPRILQKRQSSATFYEDFEQFGNSSSKNNSNTARTSIEKKLKLNEIVEIEDDEEMTNGLMELDARLSQDVDEILKAEADAESVMKEKEEELSEKPEVIEILSEEMDISTNFNDFKPETVQDKTISKSKDNTNFKYDSNNFNNGYQRNNSNISEFTGLTIDDLNTNETNEVDKTDKVEVIEILSEEFNTSDESTILINDHGFTPGIEHKNHFNEDKLYEFDRTGDVNVTTSCNSLEEEGLSESSDKRNPIHNNLEIDEKVLVNDDRYEFDGSENDRANTSSNTILVESCSQTIDNNVESEEKMLNNSELEQEIDGKKLHIFDDIDDQGLDISLGNIKEEKLSQSSGNRVDDIDIKEEILYMSQQEQEGSEHKTRCEDNSANTSSSNIKEEKLSQGSYTSIGEFKEELLNISKLERSDLDENGSEDTLECITSSHFTNLTGNINALHPLRQIMKYIGKNVNLYSVLMKEEIILLYKFFNLPENYQLFCLRLFTHIPKWYRITTFLTTIKINMSEDEVIKMMKILLQKKIIKTDYSTEDHAVLLCNLSAYDIKSICDDFKINKKGLKKEGLIEKLIHYCNTQSTLGDSSGVRLFRAIKGKMGNCVKLENCFHTILFRVNLLYGFTRPDLINPSELYSFMSRISSQEIILPYYTTEDMRVFNDQRDFMQFSFAMEWFFDYQLATERKQKENQRVLADAVFEEFKILIGRDGTEVYQTFFKRFAAGEVYAKILTDACEHFTSTTDLALGWVKFLLKQHKYGMRRRGKWYLRAAILYKKLGEFDEAGNILCEGLCDPNVPFYMQWDLSNQAKLVVSKKDKVQLCVREMLKGLILPKWNHDVVPFSRISAKPVYINSSPGYKRKYISPYTGEGPCTVEEVALHYYNTVGFENGFHCEGSLLHSLFRFLFWDVIYNVYVPGTFLNEIQVHPLDLHTEYFYTNRKEQIDERLNNICEKWTDKELLDFVTKSFNENILKFSLISSPFAPTDSSHVWKVIECIGRRTLSEILTIFIKKFHASAAGLPDLFVWSNKRTEYKMVEVKGEKDHLSAKQIFWLQCLAEVGAKVEVCYVDTMNSRTKR